MYSKGMSLLGSLLIICTGFQFISCMVNPKVDPDTGNKLQFNEECTKTYNRTGTGPEFVISTPNFPNPYPNTIRCGWTIESSEEAADISVKFHFFDVEPSKRCGKYDYMMLYKQGNGQSEVMEQIGFLEGYCGKQDSFEVTASAKRIFIVFFADDSRAFPGFNATYEIDITQASPKIVCLSKEGDKTCNQTVFAEERETLTVSCNAKAIPPADYTWGKMVNNTYSEKLRENLEKTKFPNGSIQIQDLKRSDEGFYKCTAFNKFGNTSQTLELKVAEKCLCKKNIYVSWHPKPPYTKYMRGGKQKGIFFHVLTKMIESVCGNCTEGHGESVLQWSDNYNTRVNKNGILRGFDEVRADIESQNSNFDIFLPIEGGKSDDRFRNVFYFIPMVDSPGVTLLAIGEEEGSAAVAIFNSVLQGWPILVLTIVLALFAGIVMWMLDTYWNEEQFPRTFSEGVVEGFWWAFVTMTTVGYGDIAPVGVPGRLFAVIWILTGLVIIAIFTGVITTSLTVTALSKTLHLYGTKVGAITNSSEYRMGVIKNAKMTQYDTYNNMKIAMDRREVQGCLSDTYVAAFHKDLFKKFRVNNVFSANKAYGIVLGKDLSKDGIPKRMLEFLETNKAKITKIVEENVDTLEEPKESAAEEASADLFNPTSALFVKSITATCIILVILALSGLMFEYAYLRPRHRMIEAAKNLEMVESQDIKEMARRAKALKEILLLEVQDFYERWGEKFTSLTVKHKAEQKKLLANGKGSGPQSGIQMQNQHSSHSAEEAVELDGTDTVDKPQTPGSSLDGSVNSSYGSSQKSLVENEKQSSEL